MSLSEDYFKVWNCGHFNTLKKIHICFQIQTNWHEEEFLSCRPNWGKTDKKSLSWQLIPTQSASFSSLKQHVTYTDEFRFPGKFHGNLYTTQYQNSVNVLFFSVATKSVQRIICKYKHTEHKLITVLIDFGWITWLVSDGNARKLLRMNSWVSEKQLPF